MTYFQYVRYYSVTNFFKVTSTEYEKYTKVIRITQKFANHTKGIELYQHVRHWVPSCPRYELNPWTPILRILYQIVNIYTLMYWDSWNHRCPFGQLDIFPMNTGILRVFLKRIFRAGQLPVTIPGIK